MITDYLAGATFVQLAESYGGSNVTARNVMERHGVEIRRGGPVSAWAGSPEQIADAVERYARRESITSIAKRIGCDPPQVSAALRAAGVAIRKCGGKADLFSDEQAREIAERHGDGESLSALAAEYRISRKMLGNLVVRGGGQVRGPLASWSQEKDEEIRDRFLAGECVGDLAAAFGCHQSSISKSLNRSGVNRPKSGPGHHSWQGGRTVIGDEYISVLVTEDDLPYCTPHVSGRVLEHRLVMGRAIGRPLTERETVHHINGDHGDNRLENLQLRFGKHGKGVALECGLCGSHNVVAVPLAE